MGMLSNIFHKIFPPSHPAADGPVPSTDTTAAAAPEQAAPAASIAIDEVDVEAILTAMADKNAEKLNWRTSIVDLLKLLSLDSSLQSRKDLAHELNYSGDTADSASMNIWLHRQVMNKLAANGGKVPADLKD